MNDSKASPYYGRDRRDNDRRQRDRRYGKPRHKPTTVILPAPSLLAEYEDIHPGFTDHLSQQAEEEQAHRHAWENDYLAAYMRNHRVGQFLSFILALALIFTCFQLAIAGNNAVAIALSVSGFGCLVVASIVSAISYRHFGKRPKHKRKS